LLETKYSQTPNFFLWDLVCCKPCCPDQLYALSFDLWGSGLFLLPVWFDRPFFCAVDLPEHRDSHSILWQGCHSMK